MLKTAISGTLIQIFQHDSLARPNMEGFAPDDLYVANQICQIPLDPVAYLPGTLKALCTDKFQFHLSVTVPLTKGSTYYFICSLITHFLCNLCNLRTPSTDFAGFRRLRTKGKISLRHSKSTPALLNLFVLLFNQGEVRLVFYITGVICGFYLNSRPNDLVSSLIFHLCNLRNLRIKERSLSKV